MTPLTSPPSMSLLSVLICTILAGSLLPTRLGAQEDPDDDDGVRVLDTSASSAARADGFVTVKSGDTLYDLSGTHLGDVYRWPQLWSYNAHITNPHWIYPGDLVYLRDPGTVAQGAGEARTALPMQYHVPMAGFMEREEVKFVGRIVGSPKQAVMLSEHDTAWVGFGEKSFAEDERRPDGVKIKTDGGEPKVGDVFAVVRPGGEVEEGGVSVGQKYLVLGSVRVSEVSQKYWNTVEVTQSWMPIERGDYLLPYQEQLTMVEPKASGQNMVARIVDVLLPSSNIGEFHYVFVNKGKKDGMEAGHRFFVYQKREGLDREGDEVAQRVPPIRVGQVMLTEVREGYSTALVIDSSRELTVGDRLEMYEGY